MLLSQIIQQYSRKVQTHKRSSAPVVLNTLVFVIYIFCEASTTVAKTNFPLVNNKV